MRWRFGALLLGLCLVLGRCEDEEVIPCTGGECVKLHLCPNGVMNVDGTSIIDIRFNPDNECEDYLLKCCPFEELGAGTDIDQPSGSGGSSDDGLLHGTSDGGHDAHTKPSHAGDHGAGEQQHGNPDKHIPGGNGGGDANCPCDSTSNPPNTGSPQDVLVNAQEHPKGGPHTMNQVHDQNKVPPVVGGGPDSTGAASKPGAGSGTGTSAKPPGQTEHTSSQSQSSEEKDGHKDGGQHHGGGEFGGPYYHGTAGSERPTGVPTKPTDLHGAGGPGGAGEHGVGGSNLGAAGSTGPQHGGGGPEVHHGDGGSNAGAGRPDGHHGAGGSNLGAAGSTGPQHGAGGPDDHHGDGGSNTGAGGPDGNHGVGGSNLGAGGSTGPQHGAGGPEVHHGDGGSNAGAGGPGASGNTQHGGPNHGAGGHAGHHGDEQTLHGVGGPKDPHHGGPAHGSGKPADGHHKGSKPGTSIGSTTPSPLNIPEKCGKRNADGVGFRITGDNDGESQYGEFPWMVAILKEEKALDQVINVYQCGGSLIHPSVVLTAAHCVKGRSVQEVKVRLGEWDTQTKNEIYDYQDRNVVHIDTHAEFNKGSLWNDVALLFLDKPAQLMDTVNTICLPPAGTNFDLSRCFASGWGKDVFGKQGTYQVILKKIELPVMPHAKCQSALRKTRLGHRFVLHKSFICAGGEKGRDTCKGDGGSPLVCPIPGSDNYFYQAGMVAWGIGCGEDGVPGVYVNVPMFRGWIDDHLRQRNITDSSYVY